MELIIGILESPMGLCQFMKVCWLLLACGTLFSVREDRKLDERLDAITMEVS